MLPIAFLSFLCLTGLLFSWCLCPTRPWFIRKVDNTIHEINRYLLDCAIRFAILLITKYLLDSVIHPLNNWIQEYKQIREIITRTYLNAGRVKRHRGEGGTYVDYDKLRVILFKPLNLPNPEWAMKWRYHELTKLRSELIWRGFIIYDIMRKPNSFGILLYIFLRLSEFYSEP